MSQSVRTYFDSRAPRYHRASHLWPWRWLRAREAAAMADCLPDLSGRVVLDLGSGAGFYSEQALDRGAIKVNAVDISERMLETIHDPRIQKTLGDSARVHFDFKFSRIIAAGLLEFVDSPLAILKNARRLATDDGQLGLLVPHRGRLAFLYRAFHRSHQVSVKTFDIGAIHTLAESSGWTVTAMRTVWPYSSVYQLTAKSDPS